MILILYLCFEFDSSCMFWSSVWGEISQGKVTCVPPWHLYPVDGRLSSSKGPALCHSNAQQPIKSTQVSWVEQNPSLSPTVSLVSLSWSGLHTTSQISPKWVTIQLLNHFLSCWLKSMAAPGVEEQCLQRWKCCREWNKWCFSKEVEKLQAY